MTDSSESHQDVCGVFLRDTVAPIRTVSERATLPGMLAFLSSWTQVHRRGLQL